MNIMKKPYRVTYKISAILRAESLSEAHKLAEKTAIYENAEIEVLSVERY